MSIMDLTYAEGWRPTEGDTVVGKVTDLAMGASQFGRYPIVTIAPDGGGDAVAVHAFHVGLKNRLAELRPQVGERIGIKYVGKRPVKSNPSQEVAVYIVKMERAPAGVWDQVAGENAPVVTAPPSDVPVNADDFAPQAQLQQGDDDIPF